MSGIGWVVLAAFVWLLVSLAFFAGSVWGSTITANRFIEDSDHARWLRDESVRDAADSATCGDDR